MNEKEVLKILKEQERYGLVKETKRKGVFRKTKLGIYVWNNLVKPTMAENNMLLKLIKGLTKKLEGKGTPLPPKGDRRVQAK